MCKDARVVFICFHVYFYCEYQIQLVAIGEEALFNSDISQVKTILISGSDCLSNTNISSNFGDSNKWLHSDRILTLKINCDTTHDFNVYCSKNDTCNIDCMTKGACDDMHLNCDGNCTVSKGMLCLYFVMICICTVYATTQCFVVVVLHFLLCFLFSERW